MINGTTGKGQQLSQSKYNTVICCELGSFGVSLSKQCLRPLGCCAPSVCFFLLVPTIEPKPSIFLWPLGPIGRIGPAVGKRQRLKVLPAHSPNDRILMTTKLIILISAETKINFQLRFLLNRFPRKKPPDLFLLALINGG